ncbi:branched-chain amino acid aminotransferase [Alphaproteobacteria bacterium]|jgi:branched-chain amino acid aminotransferase|nr:branched-chain amino acid aminotransferase [Alphaproteobacteria bacterium]
MAFNQPFDDRPGRIWYDGEMVPWQDATLHVLSHALHYASAVFEGERVYDGRIFKLTEHTERLFHSAKRLDMKIPYSVAEIDDACNAVVSDLGIKDGYVRPIAWRGSELMGVSAQQTKIHAAVAVWEWPAYFTPEARMEGIRMEWSKWKRPDPETIPADTKATGLYMICTLSKHTAEANGYNDALMLDYRGYIAEATGANIFMVIDGKILTPTPDCFLNGISRRTVIALAKKRGYEVIERHIMPEDLAKATEVFLTGTAVEVTPVKEIGEHTFTPGEITRTLLEDYDKEVRLEVPTTLNAA